MLLDGQRLKTVRCEASDGSCEDATEKYIARMVMVSRVRIVLLRHVFIDYALFFRRTAPKVLEHRLSTLVIRAICEYFHYLYKGVMNDSQSLYFREAVLQQTSAITLCFNLTQCSLVE